MSKEESPRQEELEFEISRRNYLRAAKLAEDLGKPTEEIRKLQIAAFKQFVGEYRNPEGAKELCRIFGFEEDLIRQVFQELIEETKKEDPLHSHLTRKRFDTSSMKHISLEEWMQRHFKKIIRKQ